MLMPCNERIFEIFKFSYFSNENYCNNNNNTKFNVEIFRIRFSLKFTSNSNT